MKLRGKLPGSDRCRCRFWHCQCTRCHTKGDLAVIYLHCVFEIIEGQSQVFDSRNTKETGTAAQG